MLLATPATKDYYDNDSMSREEVSWYQDVYRELYRDKKPSRVTIIYKGSIVFVDSTPQEITRILKRIEDDIDESK